MPFKLQGPAPQGPLFSCIEDQFFCSVNAALTDQGVKFANDEDSRYAEGFLNRNLGCSPGGNIGHKTDGPLGCVIDKPIGSCPAVGTTVHHKGQVGQFRVVSQSGKFTQCFKKDLSSLLINSSARKIMDSGHSKTQAHGQGA